MPQVNFECIDPRSQLRHHRWIVRHISRRYIMLISHCLCGIFCEHVKRFKVWSLAMESVYCAGSESYDQKVQLIRQAVPVSCFMLVAFVPFFGFTVARCGRVHRAYASYYSSFPAVAIVIYFLRTRRGYHSLPEAIQARSVLKLNMG